MCYGLKSHFTNIVGVIILEMVYATVFCIRSFHDVYGISITIIYLDMDGNYLVINLFSLW